MKRLVLTRNEQKLVIRSVVLVPRLSQPAYRLSVVAHADGGQAGAVVVGALRTIITGCVTEFDSVRLPSAADFAGFGPGDGGEIWNCTALRVALFPPLGKHIFWGSEDQGVNEPFVLPPGSRTCWICNAASNFVVGA